MLQAKELRFGNKVFSSKAEIITVQQILSNTIIYDTQMNISTELATVRGFYDSSSYTSQVVEVVKEAEYQDIDPILLTPGILEKCGFRNFIRDEWIVRYGNSHADFEFSSDGLKLRHPTPSRVSILYLHQLQNFFFAVTGQELEVNL